MGIEVLAKIFSRRFESVLGTCRQHQKLMRPGWTRSLSRRRFLEHDVRIRAANTKRTDGCATRRTVRIPLAQLVVYKEWTLSKIDLRVWCFEVKTRRDHRVLKRQHSLDQSGHSCG